MAGPDSWEHLIPQEVHWEYSKAYYDNQSGCNPSNSPAVRASYLTKAEEGLRHLLQKYPENFVFSLKLVAVLDDQGKLPEAEKILQKAITNNHSNGDVWYYMHYVLDKQGKKAEAETALLKARALKPEPE